MNAAFLLQEAVILHGQGALAPAEKHCLQIVQSEPGNVDALGLLGIICGQQNRLAEAVDYGRRAVAVAPGHPGVLNLLGQALSRSGQYEEALPILDRAIAVQPDMPEAYLNKGHTLQAMERYEEALDCVNRALRLQPDMFDGLNVRHALLLALGRFAEADADISRAFQLSPASPGCAVNLGYVRMLRGDWAEGWRLLEQRVNLQPPLYDALPYPRWRGEPLGPERLVLTTEQGLGDGILFAQFARILIDRGMRVTILTSPALAPLLRSMSGLEAVITSPAELGTERRPVRWAPLMSVPSLLRITADTFGAMVPYLAAEPARVAAWRERLGHHEFRVGIAWHGNPGNRFGKYRSIPLEEFAPLAAIPGVRLIALQKGPGTEQIETASFRHRVETLGQDFDAGPAFLDTAAVMMHLDAVVTCDTSIAHLAGALERRTFLALHFISDWRWMLDRDDTPWYPNMRLVRQAALGDWSGVFARIADTLRPMAKRR